MPIFGRRQLQSMLDELGPWLDKSKATDLLKRIESPDPDQALPGEYELALAWAVSKMASLEIDRQVGDRTPDIYSEDLLPGGPIIADVAAVSDVAFSGETVMRRASNIINNVCNRFRKGASRHLHYEFLEEQGYAPADRHSRGRSRYFRRRRIGPDFKMDPLFEGALRQWLNAGPPARPLRWEGQEIGVIVTWREFVHPQSNTFSSMPSLAFDARDNPLYRVLKDKERQLRAAPAGVRRVIMLGDAGCRLLRELQQQSFNTVSGQQIIETFLADTTIDFVLVFVPKRQDEIGPYSHLKARQWHIYVFDRRTEPDAADFDRMRSLNDLLPPPYLHGYQARSWHQQRMFDPQGRGHYLPSQWSSGNGKLTTKISARALHEFMAGKISHDEFLQHVVGDRNLFALQLSRGHTISASHFEATGTSNDDDYLVFEFGEDPAAGALRLPEKAKE